MRIPSPLTPDADPRLIVSLVDSVDMRVQDPAIERCGSRRPYYRIRPVVPVIQEGRVERVRKPIRLGWCDEMTRSQAKLKKQQIMASINGGDIVVQAQLPLSALIAKFRESHMPALASTTRAKYESHLKTHIEPGLGGLRLGEVDKATLEAWLMSKTSLSVSTRKDLRHILASLFRQAEEWRMWTGPNPAHRAKVGRGGPEPRRFGKPTIEQTKAFLEAIRDHSKMGMPAWKARQIAELCLMAGLRVSEALGVQWRDIDATAQTVCISRRYSRGNWDRPKTTTSAARLQIGSLAAELLFQRTDGTPDDAPIFLLADGTMPDDRDLQQHIWRPAAKLAGIYHPGFGLHSLRRLSITWRQECGATALEAMRQARHRRASTTLLYTMDDPQREALVIERMRGRIQ